MDELELSGTSVSVTTSNRAGIQRVEAVLFHLLNLGQTQGRGSIQRHLKVFLVLERTEKSSRKVLLGNI